MKTFKEYLMEDTKEVAIAAAKRGARAGKEIWLAVNTKQDTWYATRKAAYDPLSDKIKATYKEVITVKPEDAQLKPFTISFERPDGAEDEWTVKANSQDEAKAKFDKFNTSLKDQNKWKFKGINK